MDDVQFYAEGRENLRAALAKARREALKPPPKLTISQWAALHGRLSKETSAQTGDFEAFPYQTAMMDAVSDPAITTVSVMKSARVGYTKVLDMVTGYYLHQDPSPVLCVQPRVEDAEDYSKTEIMPMIRDTPVLAAIAGDPKAKDSGNTILKKSFVNGASLTLVGANSPGGFRRITARVIEFDEVDGYPIEGAGNEGDQIRLGTMRSLSFWNRKIILGSTPTIRGFSRIEKSFDEGDQRYYFVPCPHCGEYQKLEWGGPDLPYGLKWDRDKFGMGLPDTVHYLCKHNACVIQESDKLEMLQKGEWRASKPMVKGHASFHIWAAYSLFPNAAWANLVAEWLAAKGDPLARQTFYNLTLGLPYEDFGEGSLRKEDILERCADWEHECPDEVEVITAGVDVQDNRVEIEWVGWAGDEESWSLDYEVVEGDPESDQFWRDIDAKYLLRKFARKNGVRVPIAAVCVDSGGHHTQKVYEFCKARLARKVWAIKGESAQGGKRSPVWPTSRPVKRKKNAFRPVILGVNAAKDTIRARLHIEVPGPGYMHFPTDRGENYFAQLTAERLVAKLTNGFRFRVWELPPGRANEALDVRVYAYAALCSLKQFGFKLGTRVRPPVAPIENAQTEHPPLTNIPSPTAPSAPSSTDKPVSVTVGPSVTQTGAESPEARRVRIISQLA